MYSKGIALSVAVALVAIACQGQLSRTSEPSPTVTVTIEAELAADELRQIEEDRVAALVAGDVEDARPYFSAQYWLVDPTGGIWARDDYLGAVGSGAIDYASWERQSDVAVRIIGDAAILRYRASIEVVGGPPPSDLWHTDYFERVDGVWQVVWSQATLITE
jgi:hypothetical protein